MNKVKFTGWISLALILGLAPGCHWSAAEAKTEAGVSAAPTQGQTAAQPAGSGEKTSPWRKLGSAMAEARQQQEAEKNMRHADFAAFWADFRKAALAKDKNAVLALAHFPFEDGNDLYGVEKSLACADAATFLQRYDLIFSPQALAAVKANRYRGHRPMAEDDTVEDTLAEGEYVLEAGFDEHSRTRDLLFRKVDGVYRLVGLPYYP